MFIFSISSSHLFSAAGWLRLKYPGAIHGAIAGSGPFQNYLGGKYAETFMQTTTYDATAQAGSAPACAANVRATWPVLFRWGESQEGRDKYLPSFLSLYKNLHITY